jgi:NAD(P)-dependent dehydrogenase (short-subunit alcohol dehydrogenase family)
MDLLKTRRALVTGAQRGIGRAIAEAYAGQAAALILHAEPSFENDLNQVMQNPRDESSCSAAACMYEARHLLV